MMAKDIKWIGILLGVIAILIVGILLCGYLLETNEAGNGTSGTDTPPTLSGGEVEGPNNRIRLYENISSDNIESIFISNQHGSYTIARGKTEQTKGLFFIDDLIFLQDDKYSMAMVSMRSAVGNAIAISRVATDCADMSIYGLRGENSENGYYTVETKAGRSYTVYIGNRTVAGGGYYAAVAGRDGHVYVLSSTELETSVLMQKEKLISPILGNPTTEQDYFALDHFYFTKYDRTAGAAQPMQRIAHITYNEPDKDGNYPVGIFGFAEPYKLQWPTGCQPNLDNISILYRELMDFKGEEVLVVGKEGGEGISQEVLAQYGLDEESYLYSLMYSYRVNVAAEGSEAEYYDIITMVDFGEKNGKQYAHSFIVYGTVGDDIDDIEVLRIGGDIICSVDFASYSFLNWDKHKFVDDYVFTADISLAREITLKKGTLYEETFVLNYKPVKQSNGSVTMVLASVTVKSTGVELDAGLYCRECGTARVSTRDAIWVCDNSQCRAKNHSQMCLDGEVGTVTNFRTLYRILLEMRLQGAVPEMTKHPTTGAYVSTSDFFDGTPEYSMIVKLSSGHVFVYDFYTYSALHSAMTVTRYDFAIDYENGKPARKTENEYFLMTSLLDKTIESAAKAGEKKVIDVNEKA